MKIWVDGSDKAYCYVMDNGRSDIVFHKGTNNENEYLAILYALNSFLAFEGVKSDVMILSDSQLVVRQLNHEWNIKDNGLRRIAMKVWNLVSSVPIQVKFAWMPREENKAGKLLG